MTREKPSISSTFICSNNNRATSIDLSIESNFTSVLETQHKNIPVPLHKSHGQCSENRKCKDSAIRKEEATNEKTTNDNHIKENRK